MVISRRINTNSEDQIGSSIYYSNPQKISPSKVVCYVATTVLPLYYGIVFSHIMIYLLLNSLQCNY